MVLRPGWSRRVGVVWGLLAVASCGRKPPRDPAPVSPIVSTAAVVTTTPKHEAPPVAAPRGPEKPPPPVSESGAQALLASAIAAHGGAENLSRLGSFKAELAGRRGGNTSYAAMLLWRSPGSRVLVLSEDGATTSTGLDGDTCWRQNALKIVLPCDDVTREDAVLSATALRARLLVPLLGEPLTLAGLKRLGNVDVETLRVGAVTLAFHRVTHVLLELSYVGRQGTISEAFSDYRDAEGALVAGRVVTSLDGRVVDDAVVTELTPGAATEELVQRPPQIEDGTPFVCTLPVRSVAWTELAEPRLREAVVALDGFAKRHSLRLDDLGGVTVTALDAHRFQFAITVEGRAADEAAIHVAAWPAMHVAGIAHVGKMPSDARIAAESLLRDRELTAAPGAQWQMVHFYDPRSTAEPERVVVLLSQVAR